MGPITEQVDNNIRITYLEEIIIKQNSDLEGKVAEEVERCTNKIIREQIKHAWDEERDKRPRVRNLIFANIEESVSATGNERKANDTRLVKTVMKEMRLNEAEVSITNVTRLGRIGRESPRPRLIKVTYDEEDMVYKILRYARNLKEVANEDIKRVRIFKDLSISKREARRELVNEMKERNEELAQRSNGQMPYKWIIRGDQLVKIKLGDSQDF